MNEYVKHVYNLFCSALFDPLDLMNRWRGIPYYLQNLRLYRKLNQNPSFDFSWRYAFYTSFDRFGEAGAARGHYFWQDIWAARYLFSNHVKVHVDVGSRLDGFIAHILPFCQVVYVDLRPLSLEIDGWLFRRGSVLQMPFEDNSLMSLSCLHVIEHIGLGRYGDKVNPEGYLQGAKELARVLAPGGVLLISTPVGRERLYFDAHRVFDPKTILNAFSQLSLREFSLIDDRGSGIIHNVVASQARKCNYACGLFVFEK